MRRRSLLAVLLAAAFLGPAASARADGGAVRLSEKCGPYQVTVFTQPTPWRAGPVDVSVLVLDAATGGPVPDAAVTIRLSPADRPLDVTSHPATQAEATNKLLHAAAFDLPAAGVWHVAVVIDGPAGAAAAAFDLEAAEAAPAWRDLALWFVWPVVPIILFAWHQILVRRRALTGPPASPAKR